MLVDAETLEPARDGFSRVFGEANEWIKPELFESFVEITTTVVEHAGGGRGRVAPAAARGGRAGGGARPRGARDRLASDCTRAYSARAGRALRAPEGEARAAALPAAGLRPPRARVRPRPGHLPAGVRGRRAAACRASSPPPRTRRSGTARRAVGARSAPRSCSRCRPAGRLAVLRSLGRLAGRDPRRQHAPPLGRVAAAGVRDARGSRARPADVGPADRRARRRGAEARAGRRPSSTGHRSTAREYARAARRRRARTAAGRRPSASSSSGREAAVREIAALTLR